MINPLPRIGSNKSSENDPAPKAKDTDAGLLTTGDMARYTNNTLRTVRFYEEEGILRPAKRTEGGHRLFERTELDRLMLVTDLRTAGLSLDEIKSLLELKQSGKSGAEASKNAMKALATRIHDLRDKLLVLSRLQEDLERTTSIMTACLDCNDGKFPRECESCSVLTDNANMSRSMRVLWASQKVDCAQVPPGKKPE